MKNVKKLVKSVMLLSLLSLTIVACKKQEIEKNDVVKTEETTTKMFGAQNITPVAYGPDLVVTSISTSMFGNLNSPCGSAMIGSVCGQTYTAQVTVKNIGNAPVTNYYKIKYGKVTGNQQLNYFTSPSGTLAPGATHVFNIPAASYSTCSGAFNIEKLGAFADATFLVAETNEANNRSKLVKYCSE